MTEEITVMTLNLWNIRRWEERRQAVVEWINEVTPDLVALQEVVRSERHCQATWVAERTGMEAAFGSVGQYSGTQFGNAVLSRFPILRTSSRRLHQGLTDDVPRAILTVHVDAYGRTVSFSSTHLSHRFDHGWVRERQVQDIAESVSGSPDFPAIVGGDFNAVPASSEVRFIKGLHSLDGRSFHLWDTFEVVNPTLPGFTWDNRNPFAAEDRNPDRRVDYLFVGVRSDDGAGLILDAGLVCDQPRRGVWPSDHFGVMASLSCPEHKAAAADSLVPGRTVTDEILRASRRP